VSEAPKPEDFFLEGEEPATALRFGAPPARTGCRVGPLIDGVSALQAMERTIASAKSSVYLSLWIFNPNTPLQARELRVSGVASWADLLRDRAAKGVEVRVLLADFDPLFSSDLHQDNWKAYRILLAQAMRLGPTARDKLQVVVSRHPATVSTALTSELEGRLNALAASLNTPKGPDLARLANLPGIWRTLTFNAKTKKFSPRRGMPLSASIATHHQKFCVVDETVALAGGLDVKTGRIDTPAHASPRTAWHDVHCKVEGPAAVDVCRNFVDRWNSEAPPFTTFRDDANRAGLPVTLPVHVAASTLKLVTKKPSVVGKSLLQVHRTLSAPAWTTAPTTLVADVARAYQKAIGRADRFVYIENQYVRSPDLRRWIVRRANENRELQVIIVLPVAPEEVGLEGGADRVTLLGLHLQHEFLTELQTELGARFGVFSMVKREKALKAHATDSFGSHQVYVHTKALIIDDVYSIIGSANANPRSFRVDTELNLGWFDPALVPAFRVALWSELLGPTSGVSSWKPADYVSKWTAIAAGNERVGPSARSGFVVRHDPAKFPGASDWKIPDAFAEVLDLDTGTSQADQQHPA
jgi:phosphatidylserine/phosphatidylglycerophosphate/cardiolipin synthase-like enzyme